MNKKKVSISNWDNKISHIHIGQFGYVVFEPQGRTSDALNFCIKVKLPYILQINSPEGRHLTKKEIILGITQTIQYLKKLKEDLK